MVNQMINMRMENKLISELDKVIKESTYSSRSEFIKEAVRKAVTEYHKQKAFETLSKYKGYGKQKGKKISDSALEKAKQCLEKSFFD